MKLHSGIMTVAEKFLKKYFTNEALDYFCSKVCKIESDKAVSLSYSVPFILNLQIFFHFIVIQFVQLMKFTSHFFTSNHC